MWEVQRGGKRGGGIWDGDGDGDGDGLLMGRGGDG